MNIPILLTLVRLFASILIVPFVFPCLLHDVVPGGQYISGFIFLFVSLTDYFDGYCARRFNQTSSLGAALDLMADKCLLLSTLIVLLACHKIHYLWVLFFLLREFLITGIRQIAVERGSMIAVSSWGKLKTFLITGALFLVMIASGNYVMTLISYVLLSAALCCSYYSAIDYGMVFVRMYYQKA